VKKLFAVVVLGSLAIVGCEKPASTKPPIKSSAPSPGTPAKDLAEKDKMATEASDKAKAEAEKKATDPKADAKDKDAKDKKDK
jgi:hypothetical protein